MTTPKVKLTEEEVNAFTSKVLQTVQLPDNDVVKDAFTCSIKGSKFKSKSSGKLYVTSQFLVFIGKKKGFGSQDSCYWHWYDIFDLSTNTLDPYYESGKITLIDASRNPSFFFGFEGGEKEPEATATRICKVIRRIFFGVNENTVLHTAVENNDVDKIKTVLDRELRLISKQNRLSLTPLIMACVKNDAKLTRDLLEYYKLAMEKKIVDVDINQVTKNNEHLLHVVCRCQNISDQILLDILQFPGINVKFKNDDDTTPLHYFCEKNMSLNCVEIGKKFFENGADPNALTKYSETPLHKSIFNNKVRKMMLIMLLNHGANPDIKGSKEGDTPLHYAARLGRKDLITELLTKGGDITTKNNFEKDVIRVAWESMQSEGVQRNSAEEVYEYLRSVQDLSDMLRRAELLDKLPYFIQENVYDPEVLCEIDDEFMNKMGIKLGSRLKLGKEIAELKKRMQEVREGKKKEKELREFERKQLSTQNAMGGIKTAHGLDADMLRKQLGGDGWEIEFQDLEFTEPIGKGTSGSVFAGLYKGQAVAIKVLSTSNIEQELIEFKKEFEILRNLNSEYMIKFYGAVVEKYLMMVMELCEKGSLYDVLLKTPKDVTWIKATSFARDMAEGLAVLHSHDPPIIHRDMKSLNLLVTKDWRCKICDFGLSRLQEGDLKTMGRLCGTFHFAGPEVFKGGVATDKFDVYSMGIVLWELLNTVATGKYAQPYAEYSFTIDYQVIVQTSQGLRPSVPVGSQMDFVELFQTCVVGEPEMRPSAREVADEIKKWKKMIDTDQNEFLMRLTNKVIEGRPTDSQIPIAVGTTEKKFSGWSKK